MSRRIFVAAAAALVLAVACDHKDPMQSPPPSPAPRQNHAPVARISGPGSAREGASVQFSATASTDPDPGDSLLFTWLSGDGRVFSGANAGLPVQGWLYADDGTYTVSVIVTDRAGAADTARTSITILNTPPYVAYVRPPAEAAIGSPALVSISVVDSGTVDTHSVVIHWGDGMSDSIGWNPMNQTVKHSYANPGSYTVSVTAFDNDGGTGSGSATNPLLIVDPAQRHLIAGYEVIDLGTLGGSSAQPTDFNDYGQIVGNSLTAGGATHAFVWQNGVMTDLGTFGRQNSTAYRISNHGTIAGGVWTDYNGYGWPRTAPTTWDASSGSGHTIDGAPWPMAAAAINESGEIAWYTRGYQYEYGYVVRNGTWQKMGSLLADPEAPSNPNATNEHGQVVGMSPAASETASPDQRAFLWENGTIRDLGVLGLMTCSSASDKKCADASANGVNENGQVAGWSSGSDDHIHAALWANGTIKDLWTAPDSTPGKWTPWNRWAVINDAGQVAGSAQGVGFFWSNGGVRVLGSLGGGGTQVVDMNEAGMVVGTSLTASGEQHAFLWSESRGMVDLGTGSAGFNCTWVVGVSFGGDIVGYTGKQNLSARCAEAQQGTRAVLWRKAN